jgi:FkbM family methyltransferase
MLKMIVYIYHKILRKVWILTGPGSGTPCYRNKIKDLKSLYSSDKPKVVDVGAHKGQTIEDLKKTFEEIKIHAFEANPRRSKELDKKYSNSDVKVYNIALGPDNCSTKMNISKMDAASGILKPTDKNVSFFGKVVEKKKTINVEQKRLDNILESGVDIIKLDVQGYELEVLKGCSGIISEVEIVLLETSFKKLYKGQKTFCRINDYMRKRNFEVYNTYEKKVTESGELAEFDVIFTKK